MTSTNGHDVTQRTRKYSDWTSTKGFNKDNLPWRLWEKAKRLHWDPADIDFSQDATDWAKIPEEQQFMVAGLARGFMVGEEGVTLDILPLIQAIADENRAEETMFLTTFAYEEAKHIDFFRRWFDAIGVDVLDMELRGRERMEAQGVVLPDYERERGLFEYGLPRVMKRLLNDRSPEAFLDAGVTYNQFIEGCLAISGYRMWARIFGEFGVFPGLQEGLRGVQRDERRHIAYGTYLCRRIIAKHPDLFEFARERMYKLRDDYMQVGPIGQTRNTGNGAAAESADGNGQGGYGSGGPAADAFRPFLDNVLIQVERRIEILEKAKDLSADQAEFGTGTEEAEEELAEAVAPAQG